TPKGLHAYIYLIFVHDGVWKYEWVPADPPKSASKTAREQKAVTDNLDPITKALNKKPDVQLKRKPGPPPLRIQRKDKNFQYGDWTAKFTDWQKKSAAPFLAGTEGKNAEMLATLAEIKQRSIPSLAVPTETAQIAKSEARIRMWNNDGSFFGKLRWLFGDIYLKFINLWATLKERLSKLMPKTKSGSGGGIAGTLLRVGMKVLRFIAYAVINEVSDRMKAAFHRAAEAIIYKLFGKEIEEFEEIVKTVKGYVISFEETLKLSILGKLESVFGPAIQI